MRTLTTLEQPPLYIEKPTPWKQKNPILHHKSLKTEDQKKTWRLYAEPKGFIRPPANMQQLKNKQNASKNTYRRNNNSDDDDEKIPEVVWERMIVRILVSVGVPLVTGVALLEVFDADLTTFLAFGSSALGIAYATLSTSWEPDRKGFTSWI